jgi:hypothetical protein
VDRHVRRNGVPLLQVIDSIPVMMDFVNELRDGYP